MVIRSREHLAALKPNGDALLLEIMHFADELVDAEDLNIPKAEAAVPNEMKAANMLIDSMTSAFKPEEFHDKYREDVLAMIEDRAKGKPAKRAAKKVAAPSNVVNLMDVLQRSLAEHKGRRTTSKAEPKLKGRKTKVKSA